MKNTGKCTVLRDYQSYIIKLVVFKLVLVEISLGTLTYERDRVLLLWLDQGLGGGSWVLPMWHLPWPPTGTPLTPYTNHVAPLTGGQGLADYRLFLTSYHPALWKRTLRHAAWWQRGGAGAAGHHPPARLRDT